MTKSPSSVQAARMVGAILVAAGVTAAARAFSPCVVKIVSVVINTDQEDCEEYERCISDDNCVAGNAYQSCGPSSDVPRICWKVIGGEWDQQLGMSVGGTPSETSYYSGTRRANLSPQACTGGGGGPQ